MVGFNKPTTQQPIGRTHNLSADTLYAIGHVSTFETGPAALDDAFQTVGDRHLTNKGPSFGLLQFNTDNDVELGNFGAFISTVPNDTLLGIFGNNQQRVDAIRRGANPIQAEEPLLLDYLSSDEGKLRQLNYINDVLVPEASQLLRQFNIQPSRQAMAHALDMVTQRGMDNIKTRVLPYITKPRADGTRPISALLDAELRGLEQHAKGTQGRGQGNADIAIRRLNGFLKLAGPNRLTPDFQFDEVLAERLTGVQLKHRTTAGDSKRVRQLKAIRKAMGNPVVNRLQWELDRIKEIERLPSILGTP